jgi:hypothetical protein
MIRAVRRSDRFVNKTRLQVGLEQIAAARQKQSKPLSCTDSGPSFQAQMLESLPLVFGSNPPGLRLPLTAATTNSLSTHSKSNLDLYQLTDLRQGRRGSAQQRPSEVPGWLCSALNCSISFVPPLSGVVVLSRCVFRRIFVSLFLFAGFRFPVSGF